MQIKLATIGTVCSALLAGCGGGSNNDTAAAAVCRPTMANPDLCSDSTGVGTTNLALFTTAPSAVTLTSDGVATYKIGGGSPAYTATSSNPGVVTASVTGDSLTISSVSQGKDTPIVVVDSFGKAVTIKVTVLAKGEITISPDIFTTAPSAVTMTSEGAVTYTIGGGTPPYKATSSNPGIVMTSITGNSLTLSSLSQGATPIVVVDSLGKAVTIDVTVLSRGQVGIPPSIFPSLITVSDCTTNIPFLFSGGTAPFTIISSDNFRAQVSTALPLNLQSYFTTSINLTGSGQPLPSPLPTPQSPYKIVVTVLDSQFRTATANIEVPNWAVIPNTATPGCPVNPLLQIVSASQNAHVNEILAFQITGGLGPYTYTFTDEPTNPETAGPVAAVANDNNPDINTSVYVKVMKPGTTLLTVTSADLQKAHVRLIGLPSP